MSDYVWMRHPDLPDNSAVETPRQAFDDVHRHRGWVECEAPEEPTQADLDATVTDEDTDAEPDAEPDKDTTDKPTKSGGRSAARGKAGTSKGKE